MKTAVLGLGFMGSMHVRALTEMPGAKLVAVCSDVEKQLTGDLSSVQGNLGGPGQRFDFTGVKPYRQIPDLLADPEIEAVDICLPTFLHEETAIAALRAGKHVLVEKPMALDGAGARRMIAAARESGRLLMCAQVLRFLPEYVVLKDAMAGLGAVRSASFERRCAQPAWGGWLKDSTKSGGGVFDLLIHDIDACLWLFGMPRAVAATGSGNWVDGQLYYDGFTVGVEGGWQDSPAYPFCMEYRVTMERGTVEYSSAGKPPVLFAETEQKLAVVPADGYAAEVAYFVECCAAGKAPERCPPEQSAQAVELMRAVLDARARNGEKIACGNRE
jgi:predicted dehydrogenase